MPLASTTEAVALRLRPTARIFFPPISTSPVLEIADPRVQTQHHPAFQQNAMIGVTFRALQLVEGRRYPRSRNFTGEQLSRYAGHQPGARPHQTAPRRRRPTAPHLADLGWPCSASARVIDHRRLLPYPSYARCEACERIARLEGARRGVAYNPRATLQGAQDRRLHTKTNRALQQIGGQSRVALSLLRGPSGTLITR